MHKQVKILCLMVVVLSGCQKQMAPKRINQQSKEVDTTIDASAVHKRQSAKVKKLAQDVQKKPIIPAKEIDAISLKVEEIAAHYVWDIDVPVPLNAKEKNGSCRATPHNYQVSYAVQKEKDGLMAFYQEQMELHGWHCWWQTEGNEALLLFKKPQKHCAISIRPVSRKRSEIVIMQQVA